jgi:hypothetical protein
MMPPQPETPPKAQGPDTLPIPSGPDPPHPDAPPKSQEPDVPPPSKPPRPSRPPPRRPFSAVIPPGTGA